jgi:EAL domain-containing protein (putative c-di-GMP-specific phosphodiesterase class I)
LEHGIEQGQGYLFSRPLSLDAAIASLSATS